MSKKHEEDRWWARPYVLKIECSGCGSKYEIHCQEDRGGSTGPLHCCYCDQVFINTSPTTPIDPYHPEMKNNPGPYDPYHPEMGG